MSELVPDSLRDRLQSALGASYTLERELGGGGMSRVFLAEDAALGRTVVVKVLSPELAEGLSAERFAREIRVAAALQAPHIVSVLSAGATADGLPYYTMPFVAGESLRARLLRGPVPLGDAVGFLRDVATALEYAHERGIVHRDIKPENVLLARRTAVVTDFGIAKAVSGARTRPEAGTGAGTGAGTLTAVGTSLGTPAYMAPEQALGDAVDARVDLYAWGVLAYELLAGTHPFAGRVTAQQLVAAHIAEAPPPLEVRAPGVPRALATLVMRCLAKAPADRPQSATELLAAFDDGRSAERDLGGARGAPARRTGRRTVLGLGLTGLVLVLGAAGLAWRAAATRTASAASTAARGASDPASAGALQALAVLPFATVGGDTANAYFAEGMADELSNALAKVPALRLRGRGSLRRLREASAQEVGRALGVDGIITGSVRRAGGRLRVSVQLADASTGLVRWSDSYEREARDVFAVQDDITRAVVEALRVTLAGGAPRAGEASGRGTTSAEAYDLYLRALYLYQRRGSGLRQAEDYLEQAIGRDPSFARANALLALVLLVKPYYVPVGPADILPRASAAAQRAVALDSALADAHAALGTVLTTSSRWSGAEAEFRRALALDPTTAETHLRYGTMLLFLGRIREGLAALERARALDPLSPVIAAYLGHALALAGRLDESLVEGRRALDLDPTGVATYGNLVLDYVAAGRLADAVALTRRLRPSFRNVHYLGLYGYVFGRAGARAEALETLRALDSLPPTTFRIHSARARVHLGLDDTASALTALERAADTGGELLPGTFSLSDPMYDPVRRSARFAALLRRYDLDPRIFTAATGGRLP